MPDRDRPGHREPAAKIGNILVCGREQQNVLPRCPHLAARDHPSVARGEMGVEPNGRRRIEHDRDDTSERSISLESVHRSATYPRVVNVVRAGRVPYLEAWDAQRTLHAARVADEIDDTVLLLEHDPVYTAGRRTEAWERPAPDLGVEVVDVDRGGRITWHGPGQLTGYPIVRLADPVDVVAHVRRLEEVLIAVCSGVGVTAARVE